MVIWKTKGQHKRKGLAVERTWGTPPKALVLPTFSFSTRSELREFRKTYRTTSGIRGYSYANHFANQIINKYHMFGLYDMIIPYINVNKST